MVDGDSQRAMPVHKMSVMIVEEDNTQMLKRAMHLHSMKLIADTSIVTRAPDIETQRTVLPLPRTVVPPPRTFSVLGKRRRSQVAQVLVALHRRQAEAAQHCLQRTISPNLLVPEARLQFFDEHEHCEEPFGIARTARYVPQVVQKEEEEKSTFENDDREIFCTTPTHRRRQEEGLVCPAAPSKPTSKPRQPTPPYKKFFVPTNLADLPPCFKSLFT